MQDDGKTMLTTPSRAPSGAGERAALLATAEAGPVGAAMMGALEAEQYAKAWRRSYRFRKRLAEAAGASGGGFGVLREAAQHDDADEDEEVSPAKPSAAVSEPDPVTPDEVAARLLFARLFDAHPDLLGSVRSSAPTVVTDIADGAMLDRIVYVWHEVLYPEAAKLLDVQTVRLRGRKRPDAMYLVVKEPPKIKDRMDFESRCLTALSLALPFFAFSPLATTHLPQCVLMASPGRLVLGSLDSETIARIIRIVTGKSCRERVELRIAAAITLSDLIVAVRFDRSPAECVAELRRLADGKDKLKKSRDLSLSQLHGLGEAREWAESAIADIRAWKAGEIGWDAVASAVALTGPPGTGKTTFAKVFAAEAGLDLITATLAKWQSSGEAHLGHLLRAMRQDFDAARSRAPSVLFIDEIDSFPDRAGLTHVYKDYVIEVVNALLEQIDGIAGREGVVVIGASNDLTRCDPALLRSGRLERIVKIGLPDAVELEKMLRVRLGTDLTDEDLSFLAEAALGMTGADVERVVKDARRAARQAARDITIEDVRGALVEEDDRAPELRWRACLHEAAHIVVDVLHFGADDIFASSAIMGSSGGRSVRLNPPKLAGTYDDYHKRLQIILAGRLGEELLLSASSHGAGGAPGSDLDQATRMAAAMAGSIGLSGPTPLVYRGPIGDSAAFLEFEDIRIAVHDELSKAAATCRDLLRANRVAVEAVAQALFERSRVDGSEVARMLQSQGTAGQEGGGGCPH